LIEHHLFYSLKPESDSFVNLDHLGYTLSEELLSGSVLIKWDLDQIIVPLKNEELLEGEHPLNPLLDKIGVEKRSKIYYRIFRN